MRVPELEALEAPAQSYNRINSGIGRVPEIIDILAAAHAMCVAENTIAAGRSRPAERDVRVHAEPLKRGAQCLHAGLGEKERLAPGSVAPDLRLAALPSLLIEHRRDKRANFL